MPFVEKPLALRGAFASPAVNRLKRKHRMTVADANPVVEVPDAKRADRSDRAFLGHPKGLGFLAFAEGCERFSYYGMQALLVLYMTHQLLLPGHVEHIAGFGPFRAALEGVYGPLSPQA